jgi:two-component system LytT family response regulator
MEKAVVIEDEYNVRQGLIAMIQEYCPALEIVGEADSINQGEKIINELKPDIVFLDIRLPDGTGFELLKKVISSNLKVIFVTAYSDYALKAIKYSAIDYILKPVIPDELVDAVEKATRFIHQEKEFVELISLNEFQNKKLASKIVVKTKAESFYLEIDSIICCKADGNYSVFHLNDSKTIMVAKTLKFYEEILTEHDFVRIHQSYLVNQKYIVGFQNDQVKLTNGDALEVSRRKKGLIIKLFSKNSIW